MSGYVKYQSASKLKVNSYGDRKTFRPLSAHFEAWNIRVVGKCVNVGQGWACSEARKQMSEDRTHPGSKARGMCVCDQTEFRFSTGHLRGGTPAAKSCLVPPSRVFVSPRQFFIKHERSPRNSYYFESGGFNIIQMGVPLSSLTSPKPPLEVVRNETLSLPPLSLRRSVENGGLS